MRKLLLFSLVLSFAIYTSSHANEVAKMNQKSATVSLFPIIYSASSGQFFDFKNNKGLKPGDENYSTREASYSQILEAFQNTLKTKGFALANATKDQADFQIIFADVPFNYEPDSSSIKILPDLIKNKFESNHTPQHINSPWLKANIYYNNKHEVVGGTILLIVAPAARLNELYYSALGRRNDFLQLQSDTLDQLAINQNVFNETTKLYQENFLGNGNAPSEDKIKNVLDPLNSQAFQVAHVASISTQSTFVPFDVLVQNKIEQCVERSSPYYLSLYKTLFLSLLTTDPLEKMDHNSHYNFLPNLSVVESLQNENKNYNCFSKK